MARQAEFTIKINGLQESVNAVDSLNRQLDILNQKTSKSSSSSSRSSSLSEEEKLARQIQQIDEKREVVSKEIYQNYLAAKDVLKAAEQDQKQLAASERLALDNYSNTMAGMKQHLADLKTAMQTMDLGDAEGMGSLTTKANEINEKLKEIEQSYGQFGRNVGNYAQGVADGMSRVTIMVGGVERTFDSAREASRTLNNELKAMALNGQQGTKAYSDLNEAVKQMNSTMNDTSKSSVAMDNLLDTMQSITAIGSVAKGFGAVLGFDDSEIQKSVQKLIALQTAMQGLETLNKQLQTQEGIGGWLSKGSKLVDDFVAKLVGVETATKAVTTATEEAAVAQSTVSTAATAAATAEKGLAAANTTVTTTSKVATVATRALSVALKTIPLILIISLVAELIANWKSIVGWFQRTFPVLNNLTKAFNTIKATILGLGRAILNSLVNPIQTFASVIKKIFEGDFSGALAAAKNGIQKQFKGTADAFKKGYADEVNKQQEKITKKQVEEENKRTKHNLEMLKAQNGNQEIYSKKGQELMRKDFAERERMARGNAEELRKIEVDKANYERELKEYNSNQNKVREKNYASTAKVVEQGEKEIADLQIRLMKSSFDKEMAQLKLNYERACSEIIKNGVRVQELLKLQEEVYLKERNDLLKTYNDELTKSFNDLDLMQGNNELEKINYYLNNIKDVAIQVVPIISSMDFDYRFKEGGKELGEYSNLLRDLWEFYNTDMNGIELIGKSNDVVVGKFLESFPQYKNLKNEILDAYSEIERFSYAFYNQGDGLLAKTFEDRRAMYKTFYDAVAEDAAKFYKDREEQLKINLANEERIELEELEKWRESNLSETDTARNEEVTAQYEEKRTAIVQKYSNKRKEIESQTQKDVSSFTTKWYKQSLTDLQDYYNEISNLVGKQPTKNNIGFIDVKETKKNLKEAEDAIKSFRKNIGIERANLRDNFNNGLITIDDYNYAIKQLDDLEKKADEAKKKVGEKIKGIPMELAKEALEYVNIALDAASQILDSFDQIQQAKYEKRKELIEKETEELEKQLEKQKELTQKYADEVNDIEDELKDSRGARRQFLIDQLNAQMEAQRESLAQEKKMEKEREKLEERKKKLEDAENKRKKKVALVQAAINTALSISYAAMNTWPMPAVAMMAAAAAVGAAQIAAISAQKYADGGLLQGKSHKEGGIPVGNTGIEVEGNEYIIRKKSSMKNLPLLDYINKSEHKVSLGELVDFFGDKTSKSIKGSSPKRIFADGGQIPSLNTDLQFNSRLIQAMEDYSNRPTVVSVVDIIDRTSSVNNVRTLAGLN